MSRKVAQVVNTHRISKDPKRIKLKPIRATLTTKDRFYFEKQPENIFVWET
jgi:hypothetical protein